MPEEPERSDQEPTTVEPYWHPTMVMSGGIELRFDNDELVTARRVEDAVEGQLGIAFPDPDYVAPANCDNFSSDNWTQPDTTQRNSPQPDMGFSHARPVSKTKSSPVNVGEEIARLRKAKGIGVVEFATAVGIHRSALYDIERGAVPRDATLKRIADELEVPVEALSGGEASDEHGGDQRRED